MKEKKCGILYFLTNFKVNEFVKEKCMTQIKDFSIKIWRLVKSNLAKKTYIIVRFIESAKWSLKKLFECGEGEVIS